MTLREKIDCMEAFERGEEIEIKNCHNDWSVHDNPIWNWVDNNYRIKPKPKQVTIEKWLCKSSWDTLFIQEAEPSYFKGSGYNFNQVKLLSTREVEID